MKFRILCPGILLIASLNGAGHATAQAPSPSASLHGTVLDPSGAAIVGALVTVKGAGRGVETDSNADGQYSFVGLRPGTYSIEAKAKGFDVYRVDRVMFGKGESKQVDLKLAIAAQKEEVTVAGTNQQVGVGADQNASATIIRGSALDALSDDPSELQGELQALAGPAAGPNGGEIYIDGFAGGQIPPKSSILEIRVNQDPFSAEFDRIGYGRVEIITKPGSQKLQGSVSAGGNPSAVNTANPLVADQPSYYQYTILGNVGGPIAKNAAYYFNGYRMIFKNQNMVDALNPADLSANIRQAVPAPVDTLSVNPRIDVQLNADNFLSLRDAFYRTYLTGQNVGALDLPSQASTILSEENALQLGETFLVNPHFVNETHIQWSHIINNQEEVSGAPTVILEGAFTNGGNNSGAERDTQNNLELQNYSTATAGNQTLRFGTRLRLYNDTSFATSGEIGKYTFETTAAYMAAQPTQYTATVITNPAVSVKLFDGAAFFQDDWKARPNFDIGMGLRLEGQNRIHDHDDWAPRLAIAWSPKTNGAPAAKTIVRAGYGWFYNRFTIPNSFAGSFSGTPYIAQAVHNNGINQTNYVVQNPDFYDPATQVSPSMFAALSSTSQSIQTIDRHFHAALDMQAGAGVDRQIAKGITANVTYLYTRGVHSYLNNSINAPTFDLADYTLTGPAPAVYNYQFQSGGVYRQNQLIFSASVQLKRFIFTGNYLINEAKADATGVFDGPSVAADPGLDYGRAPFGYRQRLTFLNSYTGPGGIVFASVLTARSGVPYDITIGEDLTGNNLFNARPTFGACGAAGVVSTRYGCLDTDPVDNQTHEQLIPFDLGTGPANVVYHVRFSKVVGVGPRTKTAGEGQTYTANGNSVTGRGIGNGGAAVKLDQTAPRRFNLTFVVGASNVLNIVNLGTPNGVLLSPLFNSTQTLATGPFANPTPGNRAINFQTTFSF
ncbi:MAG: carboxypeptidase regulatory-like domain-containing protein [Terracidiphilus sp.]